MSSVQDAFRQARNAKTMTKSEAKAMRATRKAQRGGEPTQAPQARNSHVDKLESRAQPSNAVPVQNASEPQVDIANTSFMTGLSDNSKQGEQASGAANQPATPALPAGFFDDQKADAAAHGVRPPTKKDKDAEFIQFQLQIEKEVQKQAENEAEEAEQAASRRQAEEDFGSKERMKRIDALKNKQKLGGLLKPSGLHMGPKRARMQDVLKGIVLGGSGDASGSDSTDNEEDASLLDWRAKKARKVLG